MRRVDEKRIYVIEVLLCTEFGWAGVALLFYGAITIVTENKTSKRCQYQQQTRIAVQNRFKFNLGHPVPVHLALCSGYRTRNKRFQTPNRNLVNPQLLCLSFTLQHLAFLLPLSHRQSTRRPLQRS